MKKIILLLAIVIVQAQAIKLTDIEKYNSLYCYYYGTSERNGFYTENFKIVETTDEAIIVVDLDSGQANSIRYCDGIVKTLGFKK